VELDVVQGEDVGGVGDRHDQTGGGAVEDEGAAALGDGLGEGPHHRGGGAHPGEVQDGEAELVGQRVGDGPLVGQPQLDEQLAQPAARPGGALLVHEHVGELGRGDHPGVDQHVAQAPALQGLQRRGARRDRQVGQGGRPGGAARRRRHHPQVIGRRAARV
jgi:hypothetical protein